MTEVGTAIYANWWELSAEQQVDVKLLREKMCDIFITEIEAFYKVHPELKVDWQFTLSAIRREAIRP